MFENDTSADDAVSRRSVLKTTGGLIAGSTALAGLGSERGAATPDRHGPMRAELRERNEEYVAVEVWFPQDTYDEIEPLNDVYLGDADQFVVHAEEDAVSLPEKAERMATPVEMDHLDSDESYHGKLMYFRTGDVDWPNEYDGVEVTLGIGAFPERIVPENQWDTCPGLWIDVREMTEDYIVVDVRFPRDTYDDVEFPQDTYLGRAERFEIHAEERAVSLPEETDGLANPIEMDFENPHEARMYFRTEDVDLSEAEDGEIRLGLGVFAERTIPGPAWDANTVARG